MATFLRKEKFFTNYKHDLKNFEHLNLLDVKIIREKTQIILTSSKFYVFRSI
jgi:hypothetical protein